MIFTICLYFNINVITHLVYLVQVYSLRNQIQEHLHSLRLDAVPLLTLYCTLLLLITYKTMVRSLLYNMSTITFNVASSSSCGGSAGVHVCRYANLLSMTNASLSDKKVRMFCLHTVSHRVPLLFCWVVWWHSV